MTRSLALVVAAAFLIVSPASAFQAEKAKTGWLGVSIQDVTKELMKEKDLKSTDGAYIIDVTDESPADSAGIKKGDVIIEFAGRTIYDASDLSKAVSRTNPGMKATVVLMRKGEKKNLAVVIQKQPRRRGYATFFGRTPRVAVFHSGMNMLGLSLLDLNEQLAEYFGAPNGEGVLIQEVKKGSSSEKAGVKAGDVLLRVGTRSIEDMDDVSRALNKYDEGDKVEIEVLRKGSKKTMSVEIEEMEDGPWGGLTPATPDSHLNMLREPNLERFDTDRFNEEFQYKIAPKLKELEYKIRSMPRIEINQQDLQRKIQESVLRVNRIRML